MAQNGMSRDRPSIRNPYDFAFKVMLIGDSGVGKTCVLIRFKDGAFLSGSFISTVGIDFRNKTINVDGKKVKLQIWDTAGQERFRSITHAYYRDAHALLLLYDVGSRKTYDNTRAWLSEIKEYAPHDAVVMLLGNKCDLTKERQVKREEGEKLASDYNVPFLETSAKTGMNVDLAFEAASRELMHLEVKGTEHGRFNIGQYVSEKEQKPGCCG
ncbi:ras-related protein Rab-26-like isoform X2 [Hydractinia symbiolongicarpus]|uniref:ras-related protein Rab-26-like isoform X2 n=1 Tax=Hydractinia symbiolongicarpus TaxID=13093 RepID=UPI0025503DB1|nr:ras-related protein Rab-26-like isoform X2 [Hydractinia symbiolongicarpus]